MVNVMKKILLLIIIITVTVLCSLGAVTEVEAYILPESYYTQYEDNVMSKYFNDSETQAQTFIKEYSSDITMKFAPVFNGFTQKVKFSPNREGYMRISSDNFIIGFNDDCILPDEINIGFTLEDVATGKFTSTKTIKFKADGYELIPASIEDYQNLLDILSVGRGYAHFTGRSNNFSISGKIDIYYVDILFCSLWMNAGMIPDIGWYGLLH